VTAAPVDVPTLIRPIESRDLAFVWETSLKVRKPYGVPWTTWRDEQGPRALKDLNAPHTSIRVMESDGVLVGFAHGVGAVLLMLYVKRDLRGFGYGLQLLGLDPYAMNPDGVQVYVHRPNACWRRWCLAKNLRWREV